MPRWRWLAVSVVLLLVLAACGRAPAPLTHDAYVWQRQWNPAVIDALGRSTDLVREWRVLAAQSDERGQLKVFSPDRAALAASGRPVVLVVRIDGQLVQWDESTLVAQVLAVRDSWPGAAGIEIDHDCGTARLPAYAHFLGRLKQALGDTPLSITALPAWMSSKDLDGVLAAVDETVLQVHAVQSPHAGLFDSRVAREWIDRFAARSRRPFRVALPNYGTRVSWDENGRLVAVRSETTVLTSGETSSELAAAPADVAALLASLRDDPPQRLAGIVWFRLPTTNDDRAWSLPTWRAVVTGAPLRQQLSVFTQASTVAGASDLVLRNDGDVDVSLPRAVALPAGCAIADGINGYALMRRDGLPILQRAQDGWLHAHRQRAIGWARCGDDMSAPRIES
ncbi:MAG TPA: DUF3142 domain-containing protein [Luteibacter sp.]|nr:DUF3142 domain-containing protein [Luteibacter sp.]